MFENVEDKLQTVEEACAFICNQKQTEVKQNYEETIYPDGKIVTNVVNQNNASSMFLFLSIVLIAFLL